VDAEVLGGGGGEVVFGLDGKVVTTGTSQSYGMGREDERELRVRSETNQGYKEPIFILLVA
jgi:hypothetical protein